MREYAVVFVRVCVYVCVGGEGGEVRCFVCEYVVVYASLCACVRLYVCLCVYMS